MTQQFTTKSGSNYMVVPYQAGTSTLLQKKGKEYETIGRIYSPNGMISEGQPFVCRFTPDNINGSNANKTLQTSMVATAKEVKPVNEQARSSVKDGEVNVPEFLVDGYEVYTKNTMYRLEDTKDPRVKLVFGGQFNGQEAAINGSVEAGKPLSFTLTNSPVNGKMVGQIMQTSAVQGVRSVIFAKDDHQAIATDSFEDSIKELSNYQQANMVM